MEPIYTTEIREIGPEVAEFLEGGYLILFQTGAPPELAEMSVTHEVSHMRPEPPEPGDILSIGENSFRITAVGDKAWQNIEELGHAIFVFNGFEEPEMPGQICLEEGGTASLTGSLQPGSRLQIKTGVEAAV